jgi:hypothetical protein
MNPAQYCREVETYLCRKNDGHLIRIVGPAFEQVCGWAARGIPLSVVFRGVDLRFDRYHAKGRQRRPLRIEFCETDVLEIFDEWRRAVGIDRSAGASGRAEPTDTAKLSDRRGMSLTAHLDRVIARLTGVRSEVIGTAVADAVGEVVAELDGLRAEARTSRGEARMRLTARLRTLDETLVESLRCALGPDELAACRRESEAELASFRARMPDAAFERAMTASTTRLIRQRFEIPSIVFD